VMERQLHYELLPSPTSRARPPSSPLGPARLWHQRSRAKAPSQALPTHLPRVGPSRLSTEPGQQVPHWWSGAWVMNKLQFKVKLVDGIQKVFVDSPWPSRVIIDKALLSCNPKFIDIQDHVIRITVENGSATYWRTWGSNEYVERFILRDCTYCPDARAA
jgi:hypothetical protein